MNVYNGTTEPEEKCIKYSRLFYRIRNDPFNVSLLEEE